MSDDTLREIMKTVANTDGVEHNVDELMALTNIAKLITEEGLSIEQVTEYADSIGKGASREDALEFARSTHLAQVIQFPTARKPS
jgi:hypothetical protein